MFRFIAVASSPYSSYSYFFYVLSINTNRPLLLLNLHSESSINATYISLYLFTCKWILYSKNDCWLGINIIWHKINLTEAYVDVIESKVIKLLKTMNKKRSEVICSERVRRIAKSELRTPKAARYSARPNIRAHLVSYLSRTASKAVNSSTWILEQVV